MSHQQRVNAPRGFARPKRARSKSKAKRHRTSEAQMEEKMVPSLEEVVEQALNGLNNLGSQVFALSPFQEHFDRWLMNLRIVMDDFESSPVVKADDLYKEERAKIFSNIESAMMVERHEEESRVNTLRALYLRVQGPKKMLLQVEQEYNSEMSDFKVRKEQAIRSITEEVEIFQEELDDVRKSRTGLLSGITKKIKPRREERVALMLASVKKRLEEVSGSLSDEESKLQKGYEDKKMEIARQLEESQKEIKKLESFSEVDGSVTIRHEACEKLAGVIKAQLNRMEISPGTSTLRK